MKKSEIRKLIREQIKNIHEQSPPGGYYCMNHPDTYEPGYCVLQVSQQSVWETMQNEYGMGVWGIYPTLEACIASPQCSEEYTQNVYPPPTGGPTPGPFVGGNPIKGPIGNTLAPASKKRPMKPAKGRKKMAVKSIHEQAEAIRKKLNRK